MDRFLGWCCGRSCRCRYLLSLITNGQLVYFEVKSELFSRWLYDGLSQELRLAGGSHSLECHSPCVRRHPTLLLLHLAAVIAEAVPHQLPLLDRGLSSAF